MGCVTDEVKFLLPTLYLFQLIGEGIRIESCVGLCEAIAAYFHVKVEVLSQAIHITTHTREVEMQHLEAVAVLRRMVCHIHSLEQLLEVVLFVDVVVGFKHVQEQTLAKAARADEEEKIACPFHPLEEHGLIHQIFVFLSHLLEVSNAIGYLLEIVAHHFFHLHLSFLQIYAISPIYASIYSIKKDRVAKEDSLVEWL